MSDIRLITIAALFIFTGCYFQVGGRDVHLEPDELWREARQACYRRDPRAQRFLLERIVERHPSSHYAPPARRHLESLPVCSAGDDANRLYHQNIGPGGSDSTQTSDNPTETDDEQTPPSS